MQDQVPESLAIKATVKIRMAATVRTVETDYQSDDEILQPKGRGGGGWHEGKGTVTGRARSNRYEADEIPR